MTTWLIVAVAAVVVGVFQGELFFKRVTNPLARFGFGFAVTGAFLAAAGVANPALISMNAVPGIVVMAVGIALGFLYRKPT